MGFLWGDTPEQDQFSLALGSSLLGGQNMQQQLGGIAPAVAPVLAQQAQNKQSAQTKASTLQMLQGADQDLAQAVEAGAMTPADAVKMSFERKMKAEQPRRPNIISVGNGMLYDMDNKSYISPPEGTRKTTKRGLNPIWGKDAQGNTVMGTLGEDGSFEPVDVPEGFQPTPGTSTIDLGTSIGIRDNKSGNIIRELPKDIAGVEKEKAQGKVQGESTAALAAVRTTAGTIKDMIKSVKDDEYRLRGTGFSSMLNNIPATGGYDFQKKVDQLKGQSFLQAIQQMQGFGALSNQEGATATAAISRLDTAQSEEAFNAALDDLEKVIDSGVRRVEAMSQGKTETAPPVDNSGNVEGLVEKYRTK